MRETGQGPHAEVHPCALDAPHVDLADVEGVCEALLGPSSGFSDLLDAPSDIAEEEIFGPLAGHTGTLADPCGGE